MTTSSLLDSPLSYAWARNRVWAATSQEQKRIISWARLVVLALTILGAVFGQLCQTSGASDMDLGASIFGYLSAATMGTTAFLALWLLGPERTRTWIRSRSLAESLKSEFFLCRARVGGYRSPEAAQQLLRKVEDLEALAKDISTAYVDPKTIQPKLDSLTVDEYIEQRVLRQVNGYYKPKARDHQRYVTRARAIQMAATLAAVLLGFYGGSAGGAAAGWIAVFSAVASAVAAHLYAGRHQYLVVSYQNTAARLESLVAAWQSSNKTDQDTEDRDRFIAECERALSFENDDWMIVSTTA